MRAALVQLTSSDDPEANLSHTRWHVGNAVKAGAELVLTPEVTNCVSTSRSRQNDVLKLEEEDPTLQSLRDDAAHLSVWIVIGSLALKTGDTDDRFANRSFLINPQGEIVARYDKIHMFDVNISEKETYRESDGYRPGNRAVLADTPFGKIGLTICYDMRFPALYRRLAQGGADILTAPAAFSPITGAAHWETLLRARAIETGAFVLAPAQTGIHATESGKARKTHGHSLAVAPWGTVLADGGIDPGVTLIDCDIDKVAIARRRVPSLGHDRPFEGP